MGRRMNEIQDVAGAAGAVHRREQYSKGRRALVGSDWAEGLGEAMQIRRALWVVRERPARARWHGRQRGNGGAQARQAAACSPAARSRAKRSLYCGSESAEGAAASSARL